MCVGLAADVVAMSDSRLATRRLPRVSWLTWLTKEWDPIVRRSLLLICAVVVIGTAGYTWIEGWTPWEGLFFTLVTLTTVGYGDYGLSEAGERFTAVLMIGGIGTVSFMASQLVHSAMARATKPERRMMQYARHMQGHFIVCGLGRTGRRVVETLDAEGATVLAIDIDPRKVEAARDRGIVALEGDATSDEVLEMAGIERAIGLAAVSASDPTNAMICLTAHAIAPDVAITARACDASAVEKLKRAGASGVVSPTSYGGDGIAQNMLRPEVAKLLFGMCDGGGSLSFAEVAVGEGSPMVGKSVKQLGEDHPRIVFVASRLKGGELVMRPAPGERLGAGDVLVVAGTPMDVGRLKATRLAA
mgnify:FL=1